MAWVWIDGVSFVLKSSDLIPNDFAVVSMLVVAVANSLRLSSRSAHAHRPCFHKLLHGRSEVLSGFYELFVPGILELTDCRRYFQLIVAELCMGFIVPLRIQQHVLKHVIPHLRLTSNFADKL